MFSKLKDWFGPLLADRQIKTVFIVSAAIGALSWALILVRFWSLIARGKIIGLHYSIYLGLDDIGSARWILVVPAVATAILVANSVLAKLVSKQSRPAALVLAGITLFFEAMCLVAGGYLILINLKS
jgi:hypothetical protein